MKKLDMAIIFLSLALVFFQFSACVDCNCDSSEQLSFFVEIVDKDTDENITNDFDETVFEAILKSGVSFQSILYENNRVAFMFQSPTCPGLTETSDFFVNDTLVETSFFFFDSNDNPCCGCDKANFFIERIDNENDSKVFFEQRPTIQLRL